MAEISEVLNRIGERPASFPKWPSIRGAATAIRKATMRRFPYFIAFEVHEQSVLVLAVGHAKRRPLYWLTRTTP